MFVSSLYVLLLGFNFEVNSHCDSLFRMPLQAVKC